MSKKATKPVEKPFKKAAPKTPKAKAEAKPVVPAVPPAPKEVTFTLRPDQIEQMIRRVEPCISKEETRYCLNGIFFDYVPADKALYCVATDGHKLSRVTFAQQEEVEKGFTTDATEPFTFIAGLVAVKLLKNSASLMKKEWGKHHYSKLPVTFTLSEGRDFIRIEQGGQSAKMKTIDGNFPDYRRVIPSALGRPRFGLNADYLAMVVKAAKGEGYSKGVEIMPAAVGAHKEPVIIEGNIFGSEVTRHEIIVMPMRVGETPVDNIAIADVLAERLRQQTAEGWTAKGDDKYKKGELATASACYALFALNHSISNTSNLKKIWPFDMKWWKPKNRRHDLVRAAALLVAEIERLDRAAKK